jgi:hypothetical protein
MLVVPSPAMGGDGTPQSFVSPGGALHSWQRRCSVVCLVSGSSKAHAVRRAFAAEGRVDETPARLLRGATWYLDEAAAEQITQRNAVDVLREDDRPNGGREARARL